MPSSPGKGRHPQRPQDARLLHLVQVVGAPMVNVVAQASSHHGKGLQVRVVALQLARLQRQAPRFLPPASLPALPGPWGAQGSQLNDYVSNTQSSGGHTCLSQTFTVSHCAVSFYVLQCTYLWRIWEYKVE